MDALYSTLNRALKRENLSYRIFPQDLAILDLAKVFFEPATPAPKLRKPFFLTLPKKEGRSIHFAPPMTSIKKNKHLKIKPKPTSYTVRHSY